MNNNKDVEILKKLFKNFLNERENKNSNLNDENLEKIIEHIEIMFNKSDKTFNIEFSPIMNHEKIKIYDLVKIIDDTVKIIIPLYIIDYIKDEKITFKNFNEIRDMFSGKLTYNSFDILIKKENIDIKTENIMINAFNIKVCNWYIFENNTMF